MATSLISYTIQYSDQSRRTSVKTLVPATQNTQAKTVKVLDPIGATDSYFVIDALTDNANSSFRQSGNHVQISPTTFDLTFTGYRNPVYGEALWTNMLHLMEHFASDTAPAHPTLGQIWFDTKMGLGSLKLCIDPTSLDSTGTNVVPTWKKISSRIIVSSIDPTDSTANRAEMSDQILWFNPDNMGLFYWDPTLPAANYPNATAPYATIDWTGPTIAVGSALLDPNAAPKLHPQQVRNWINLLYQRYASTVEFNAVVAKIVSYGFVNGPASLPDTQQPSDSDWLNLFAYIQKLATSAGVSINLVPTTFKVYTTDRFGIGAVRQWYTALGDALATIATSLNQHALAPVADFTDSLSITNTGVLIQFTDTSLNVPTSWLWDFGDGNTATTQNVSHLYPTNGTYTVKLTATNAAGSNATQYSILVSNPAPAAAFTATPASGAAPLSVVFTDTSTGLPTSWSWNFGDGTTSTAQNPTHVYSSAGTYNVTLQAGNQSGTTTYQSVIIASTPAVVVPAPIAHFVAVPPTGSAPLAVQFTDMSTNSPTSWAWNFGDGSTSTVQNPTHVYTAVGSYTVSLTVSNNAGSDTRTAANTAIVTIPLTANFSMSTVTGTTTTSIQFTDASTGGPTAWLWNFGDGTTSTAQNPSHVYSIAGTFPISLTVFRNGASNTRLAPGAITVTIAAPVAAFVSDVTVGNDPLVVQFTDQSTNTPTAWLWDFSDGTTSTAQNPSHTFVAITGVAADTLQAYAYPGVYTVKLTVTNLGGSNSITKSNMITANPYVPVDIGNN